MTYYEVLGVERDASPAEIRAAFRRLARAHHPDTSSSGSSDSLSSINDAWRVLGDPAARRAYDRSLEADHTQFAPRSPERARVPEPVPESSFPWRFLIGLAVIGIAFALFSVFTYEPSTPGPPDNVLAPGSCVVIEDNGDASEVNCDTDHDGVVESLVGSDQQCAAAFEPHRDKQGLGVVCIRFEI